MSENKLNASSSKSSLVDDGRFEDEDQDDRLDREKLFGCIVLARYKLGVREGDDKFDRDVYEKTLLLLRSHLDPRKATYKRVEKFWANFIETGNVIPKGKHKKRTKRMRNISSTRGRLRSGEVNQIEEKCRQKKNLTSKYLFLSIALFLVCLYMLYYKIFLSSDKNFTKNADSDFPIDIGRVDKINQKFPNLLTPRELHTIKTRLGVMRKEVSILMLLGRSRDERCSEDQTHCVALMIANVTQGSPIPGYIDASDFRITSEKLEEELSESLNIEKVSNKSRIVVIDSLNSLPGNKVMNLFQFIDKDEHIKRRGLLLLILYTGEKEFRSSNQQLKKNADIAEKLLLNQWSNHVAKDTLRSVISRLTVTVVKVH